MPAWLIGLLINLAIKFGWAWLVRKFPWLPQEVKDEIQHAVDNIKKAKTLKGMNKVKLAKFKSQQLESVRFIVKEKMGNNKYTQV